MHIAITGATGLIGTALSARLRSAGHTVTAISRSRGPDTVTWDPATGELDGSQLEGIDGAVHLAGAPIATLWTSGAKRRIRTSRTLSADLLARTLASLDTPPRVLVSASGINYYGDRGDEVLTEESPPGEGFLTDVVTAWEAATGPAEAAGVRVVHARTGILQSVDGGALRLQLPLFRLGLGGWIGSGDQWTSWVTMDDEVGLLQFALEHDTLSGPVNCTAPNPVTAKEYARCVGKVLRRPVALGVPALGPRLVGGAAVDELLLASMRVLPQKATAAGYTFRHPTLEEGLRALLGRGAR